MFEKLQNKWGVRGWDFFLILITFAVTGTFTAWVSRGITQWLDVAKYSVSWWALKAFILLIGYQAFILLFGFLFGQFSFFWTFEKKLLRSLGLLKRKKQIIAIFASGNGSNAEKIIEAFQKSDEIKVGLIISNRVEAGVLDIARKNNIPTTIIGKGHSADEQLLALLKEKDISHLILAGYLWKIPESLIKAYPRRIINIHPALLPKFGGKGMYGLRVHEAVINAGETESGITIHYVDEVYDNGEIILQQKVKLAGDETPASLSKKIQKLEHKHFPEVISTVIKQNRR